jgi:flagellar biosynthesis protein FlhB
MSDTTEQDKSEQATPYKLQKARDKGTVARGMDIGYFAALATFAGYMWMSGPNLFALVQTAARRSLAAAPNVLANPNTVLAVTGTALGSVVRPLAFLFATLFIAVLAAEIIQTGMVFSTEPLRPDFSRLSPANGFKRVFSVRMLIEAAKNVAKLFVFVALAYLVVRYAITVIAPSITDGAHLAQSMHRVGLRLLAFFVVGAALFAVVDQLIARRDFGRRMRMSRREVRRELRDREGDPRVRQRRRKLHRDFAKLSQSLRNIRGADVLITNPIHYAVALRYDAQTMTAPRVVSIGSHQFALRLKKLAFVYGLVIVENKPLAKALFYACEINQGVPEEFFRPVADIYLSIRDARNRRKRA